MRSRRMVFAMASALVLALGLGGCGVSASDAPERLGDAYKPTLLPDAVDPPQPTATSEKGLVLDFLDAAVGGGSAAVSQVSAFLTPQAQNEWQRPSKESTGITIVRLQHPPTVGAPACPRDWPCGVPVDVSYQVVGTLDEYGRVELADSARTDTWKFWVVALPSGQLRIYTGVPAGLVLRDQALNDVPPLLKLGDQDQALGGKYYRQQAIYFWDRANKVLVPDIRYVPLTIAPEQRATRILQWLLHGPSPQLQQAVNQLPSGTTTTSPGVITRGSTLIVKLSPEANGNGPEDVKRLVDQLQASLLPSTGRDLEVSIGDSVAPSYGASDYQRYELSSKLRLPIQKYDIDGGQVKATFSDVNGTTPKPPILDAKANSHVVAAAIDRDNELAAFVTQRSSGPTLQIVRFDGATKARLPPSSRYSRPAWIPGTKVLLIAWAGKLWSVTPDGDATPITITGLGNVSSVSISPDGRRVALIADRNIIISALNVRDESVSLSGPLQDLVVDPNLVPAGVAWESEHLIFIAGTSAGAPALWLVTADGAVATDYSATLKDVVPTDVVAFPRGAFTGVEEAIVQRGDAGGYRIGVPGVFQDYTKHPFYVD